MLQANAHDILLSRNSGDGFDVAVKRASCGAKFRCCSFDGYAALLHLFLYDRN